ncbi:unknown protein [Cronobacter turicensis z3032]|uniref:Uncharacterized protein n=1 Tax=Cronobacter turicensis (strain DSM 18703 / CCUG 55852 / LMG 23827 / z3032) TaxID=693216 RepID=C9Y0F2_CROTZ|nr:unknown protein [Cronobacter turicensis z3032]
MCIIRILKSPSETALRLQQKFALKGKRKRWRLLKSNCA